MAVLLQRTVQVQYINTRYRDLSHKIEFSRAEAGQSSAPVLLPWCWVAPSSQGVNCELLN